MEKICPKFRDRTYSKPEFYINTFVFPSNFNYCPYCGVSLEHFNDDRIQEILEMIYAKTEESSN